MKVAVYQADASARSPQQRLRDLEQQITSRADQLPDLLLCPELYLSGYGSAADIRGYAMTVDAPLMQDFGALAAQHGVALVMGYAERGNRCVFNSAIVLSETGETLANHRKRVLPTVYEKDLFDCGTGMTLFELNNGWKAGLVICYESEIPEAVRQCARAGADLVLAPTALGVEWPVVSRCVIPARAFENNIFFAYANFAGRDQSASYIGESVILSPMGEELVRADNRECWIEARLDHGAIAPARARLNYLQDSRAI